MEFSEELTQELQKILEDDGFIVERIHSPMVYIEDLGVGTVRSCAGEKSLASSHPFQNVLDKIFLLGVYESLSGREAVRFVRASEFEKRD